MTKKLKNNILVPVNSLEDLKLTLPQANYFQQIKGANITILRVIPKIGILKKITGANRQNSLKKQQEIATELTNQITSFYKNNIPSDIKTKIVVGKFNNIIRKELRNVKYDLLIMREFGSVRALLGRLQKESEKLIERVNCPVMILHKEWTKNGIKEIIVPLDITHKCKDAVLWTVKQAKILNAKINFVSVVNTSVKVEQSLTYQRAKLIKEWVKSLDIECSNTILQAKPRKMEKCLLEYADTGNADLVIIHTHKGYWAANNHWRNFAKHLIHKSVKPVISMSVKNKPMFKLIGDFSRHSRKRTETLNIKDHEWKELGNFI